MRTRVFSARVRAPPRDGTARARGPRNALGFSRTKTSIHYATPRSINEHSRQESTVESWEAFLVPYIGYPVEASSSVFAGRPAP